jgi:hypothetical protein
MRALFPSLDTFFFLRSILEEIASPEATWILLNNIPKANDLLM